MLRLGKLGRTDIIITYPDHYSFGQEQIPIPAISAVTSGGGPGVAATLAGSAVSTILAATNPCAKVRSHGTILS
jgi:hypothetical protein